MSKAQTYSLINYFDVIGNSKDGYEINNQCTEFTDLVISDDSTKKEICQFLVQIGFLSTSDMRKLTVDWSTYDGVIEIFEKKTMIPICALVVNQ